LVLRSWGRVDLGQVDLGAEFVVGPSCLGAELTGAKLVWCRVNRHPRGMGSRVFLHFSYFIKWLLYNTWSLMVKCGADVRMFERVKCGEIGPIAEVKDTCGLVKARTLSLGSVKLRCTCWIVGFSFHIFAFLHFQMYSNIRVMSRLHLKLFCWFLIPPCLMLLADVALKQMSRFYT